MGLERAKILFDLLHQRPLPWKQIRPNTWIASGVKVAITLNEAQDTVEVCLPYDEISLVAACPFDQEKGLLKSLEDACSMQDALVQISQTIAQILQDVSANSGWVDLSNGCLHHASGSIVLPDHIWQTWQRLHAFAALAYPAFEGLPPMITPFRQARFFWPPSAHARLDPMRCWQKRHLSLKRAFL